MGVQNEDTAIEYDRENHCYRIHHDWWAEQPLSTAIAEAVATVTNTRVTDVDPLYEVLNPDALNRLYEPASNGARRENGGHTTFTVHGCDVTVFADGSIELSPPDDA